MRRILLLTVLSAVALAGCSNDEPADKTAAPASSASSSSAPAAAESSAAPSSSAAPGKSAAGASGGGCPVTPTALQKAFQANTEVAGSIILGKGFKDISCYQGWATALTQPEAMDTAVVVFKYDGGKKTWAAVVGGTDGVCVANVPADIRPHLKNC